ncbi:hypothetical protein EDD17DRAFT_1754332 [Pisolithus thermaeus]|nr:hypothetical protein EDD17DRAFT_1754332 [Pisolithus thermaeus]
MFMLFPVARTVLLIFVALNFKSLQWRLIGCSVVVAILAADLPLARTGYMKFDNVFGAALGTTVLQAIRFLLLMRPMEEYRHDTDKVPAYQLPFFQRCFWLFSMTSSPRGIGWSFRVKHGVVPVKPCHRTRLSFIASRLRWLFSHYFLLEAALLYTRYNPVYLSEASVTSQGYILQSLNVAAIPCQMYALITCVHSTLAVLAVATHFSEPQAWPQPFGRWRDAYTVRRLWGRTWHQMVRRDLTLFGPHWPKQNPWDPARAEDSSVDKPEEREPWGRRYRRLCYAFICSACMHVCGDVLLQFRLWNDFPSFGPSGTKEVPNLIGYSAPYFLWQPVGVLVEETVVAIGERMGLQESTWTRMIGYAWVWVFTSATLVYSVDGLKNAVHISYLAGEGKGLPVTLIEVIVDRVFGVQLAPVISSWFPRI